MEKVIQLKPNGWQKFSKKNKEKSNKIIKGKTDLKSPHNIENFS